jgi:NAD+ synthase
LAEYLELPREIQNRPPTTDTYSLPQSQEEFYFSLPYEKMDLCLYGKNHGVPASEVAAALGLTTDQIERVYQDIDSKRNGTRYLHLKPLLIEDINEVG